MGGASIDLKFLGQFSSKRAFGQHAFDSMGNDAVGVTLTLFFEANAALTAGEAGVMPVELRALFVARDFHFFCIHDDNEVTGIAVGRVDGLVFATQDRGRASRQSAEDYFLSIDDKPAALYGVSLCAFGFHVITYLLGPRNAQGRLEDLRHRGVCGGSICEK